jgi:hypothetical protein
MHSVQRMLLVVPDMDDGDDDDCYYCCHHVMVMKWENLVGFSIEQLLPLLLLLLNKRATAAVDHFFRCHCC